MFFMTLALKRCALIHSASHPLTAFSFQDFGIAPVTVVSALMRQLPHLLSVMTVSALDNFYPTSNISMKLYLAARTSGIGAEVATKAVNAFDDDSNDVKASAMPDCCGVTASSSTSLRPSYAFKLQIHMKHF